MIKEKLHFFDPDLAESFGSVELAVIANKMIYMTNSNQGQDVYEIEGRIWVKMKAEQLANYYPYWNERKVRRLLDQLVIKGFLDKDKKLRHRSDHTCFYAISQKWEIELPKVGNRDIPKMVNHDIPNLVNRELPKMVNHIGINTINNINPLNGGLGGELEIKIKHSIKLMEDWNLSDNQIQKIVNGMELKDLPPLTARINKNKDVRDKGAYMVSMARKENVNV